MRPIFPAPKSANQSAPSGPDAMPYGSLPDVGDARAGHASTSTRSSFAGVIFPRRISTATIFSQN